MVNGHTIYINLSMPNKEMCLQSVNYALAIRDINYHDEIGNMAIEDRNEDGITTVAAFVSATNKGDNIALDTYKCVTNIWGLILIPLVIAIGFHPGLQP